MHKSYKAMRAKTVGAFAFVLVLYAGLSAADSGVAEKNAEQEIATAASGAYAVQPGDILVVSVWKEEDLQSEVLVRPDGRVSFALAGDIPAAGHSIAELQAVLAQRLSKYIPDPVVTITVKAATGSRVYVLGKVNRPGEFALSGPLDVMQALSLAGGATPYAAVNDIRVLRREGAVQLAIKFRYNDVAEGRRLEQNILLKSGDTVVVP